MPIEKNTDLRDVHVYVQYRLDKIYIEKENIFMPPEWMIWGILFLSCLFVCLSVCCQL